MGVRVWGFQKYGRVWPAWMPQPQSCSSAGNHHPERAGGLKDYEVLRLSVFISVACLDAPATAYHLVLLVGTTIPKGLMGVLGLGA